MFNEILYVFKYDFKKTVLLHYMQKVLGGECADYNNECKSQWKISSKMYTIYLLDTICMVALVLEEFKGMPQWGQNF